MWPFEEIGCKFRKCENQLCPFRHKDHSEPGELFVDKINDNETETDTNAIQNEDDKDCYTAKNRQSYRWRKLWRNSLPMWEAE